MREIKFRGKAVNTGEFVYGSPVQADGMAQILIPITNRQSHERAAGMSLEDRFFTHNNIDPNYIIEWDFISIIPETLGQYTGFKDCNGVEIYEGDIIHYGYYDEDEGTNLRPMNFLLKWSHGDGGWVANGGVCGRSEGGTYDYEIIGNIHDNPELLESNK